MSRRPSRRPCPGGSASPGRSSATRRCGTGFDREFHQVGVEMLGAGGPGPTPRSSGWRGGALRELGIDDASLRIGHVGLILEMFERSGLPGSRPVGPGRTAQRGGRPRAATWRRWRPPWNSSATGSPPTRRPKTAGEPSRPASGDDPAVDRLFRTLVPDVTGRRSAARSSRDCGGSGNWATPSRRSWPIARPDPRPGRAPKGPILKVMPELEFCHEAIAPDSVASLRELAERSRGSRRRPGPRRIGPGVRPGDRLLFADGFRAGGPHAPRAGRGLRGGPIRRPGPRVGGRIATTGARASPSGPERLWTPVRTPGGVCRTGGPRRPHRRDRPIRPSSPGTPSEWRPPPVGGFCGRGGPGSATDKRRAGRPRSDRPRVVVARRPGPARVVARARPAWDEHRDEGRWTIWSASRISIDRSPCREPPGRPSGPDRPDPIGDPLQGASLRRRSVDLLKTAGYKVRRASDRQYEATIAGQPRFHVVFMRPADIVTQVQEGRCHLGVTGFDVFAERAAEADRSRVVIQDLGYGGCRLGGRGARELDRRGPCERPGRPHGRVQDGGQDVPRVHEVSRLWPGRSSASGGSTTTR